jgi:hypothetical protein
MFRTETEKTTDRTSTNFEDKQDFVHRYEVSPRTDYEERPPIPFNLSIFKVKKRNYYIDEDNFYLIERAKPMYKSIILIVDSLSYLIC